MTLESRLESLANHALAPFSESYTDIANAAIGRGDCLTRILSARCAKAEAKWGPRIMNAYLNLTPTSRAAEAGCALLAVAILTAAVGINALS